jgi:shikimate dehydrogenase
LPTVGPILILGAGGAAAAACVALTDRPIYLAARRFGAGADLAQQLGITIGEVHWGVPVIDSVVVNCTPIGMQGEALSVDVLATSSGLFDMAYGSEATPAVQVVRDAGLPVVEGLDLLVAQAARSFRIWTGVNPPVAVMRKAAKNP